MFIELYFLMMFLRKTRAVNRSGLNINTGMFSHAEIQHSFSYFIAYIYMPMFIKGQFPSLSVSGSWVFFSMQTYVIRTNSISVV